MVSYKEYYPGEALSPFIKCFWAYSHYFENFRLREISFPKGFLNIIFVKEGSFTIDNGDTKNEVDHSILAPHLSSPASFEYSPRFSIIGVTIYPWANTILLKHPTFSFTDGFFIPSDIFGNRGRELCELAKELDTPSFIDILRAFFLKIVDEEKVDNSLRFAVTKIASTRGKVEMDTLTKTLSITPRRIQQKFHETVGYGPKYYSRIVRFKNLVSSLPLQKYKKLTDLAYDSNFADQSHMIKEFRHFTGLNPARFIEYLSSSAQLVRTIHSEIKRDSC